MKLSLGSYQTEPLTSPSPRKAWIETQKTRTPVPPESGRLPPGRRGLKLYNCERAHSQVESPSPRKAWIETSTEEARATRRTGRLPPGRRGLKLPTAWVGAFGDGRLPPGRRGLKHPGPARPARRVGSPSPRKAWIETSIVGQYVSKPKGRLPPGRRGLKRGCRCVCAFLCKSPSPRKAWIETRV